MRRAASNMARACAPDVAIGFSHSTCLPASSRANRPLGVEACSAAGCRWPRSPDRRAGRRNSRAPAQCRCRARRPRAFNVAARDRGHRDLARRAHAVDEGARDPGRAEDADPQRGRGRGVHREILRQRWQGRKKASASRRSRDGSLPTMAGRPVRRLAEVAQRVTMASTARARPPGARSSSPDTRAAAR